MALGARLPLGLALLAALIAVLLQLYRLRKPRLWTLEELSIYNGTDEGLPILLGILGSVFDVTKGRSHYGPGGGYHHFSGRDASRAFVSGNFTESCSRWLNLADFLNQEWPAGDKNEENKSHVRGVPFLVAELFNVIWFSLSFRFAGKIVGRYHDSEGNPTKYLKGVEMKAKRGAQLLEKQKREEDKIPSCNSKWSEAEGGEVWCETGYPRLVRRPGDIALTGQAVATMGSDRILPRRSTGALLAAVPAASRSLASERRCVDGFAKKDFSLKTDRFVMAVSEAKMKKT
ncbi:unnamed protein product [Triticum turgidum subsp. durum]|uniref:Cytochrome b5 heme-binding domain-containing protein n=1 Tax=Triticum turgidum subsp. durum TaxID=4567 RepID=A0A9R0S467_TRITD|nr:unnamed protein product [Triticum turgidum subsp. durum]